MDRSVPPVVVERQVTVPLPAARVWERVTTPEGIRHELRPWLSMTTPPRLRGRTIGDLEPLIGEPLGKSWVLLLGVLPVDFDDMTIAALEPGRGFHETSRMASLPRWEHERTVAPLGPDRSTVSDRLTFAPRLARVRVVRALAARLVGTLFSHRQRRLAAWCRHA